MNTRLLFLAAAAALLPLALAGCTAVAAPLPANTSMPAPDRTPEPDPAPTPDDVFLVAVDQLKSDVDGWHYDWLADGCTDAATPEDAPECIELIQAGLAIATEGDALFTGFAGTLDDDLVPVQTGVSYATWRGAQWLDAGCDVLTVPECAELTYGLVDDLVYTHEFLQLWTR